MQKIKASTWYFAATAFTLVIVLFNIPWSPQLSIPERDVWRINPRFNFNAGIKESSSTSQSVNVHLTINGKHLELDLAENELLTTYPPFFLASNIGSVTNINIGNESMQKPKYMQDKKGRAAVMLRKNVTQQHGLAYEIEGIIFFENEKYRISPVRDSTSETGKDVEFSHELTKISPKKSADKVLRAAYERSSQDDQQDLMPHVPRARRTASTTHEVQLLYVIDYSTFQIFHDNLPYNDTQEKESAAVKNIVEYFAQVSNLVDLQYQSISMAPFTIRTKLISIYIAKTASESNWTESANVEFTEVTKKIGRKAVKGDDVLHSFTTWMYGESGAKIRSTAPKFDHAILYTAHDIFETGEYSEYIPLIGITNGYSMCTSASASVVMHTQAIYYAETCAHEIGHSLGAEHDGLNNSCDSSMQYIMAEWMEPRTNETFLNQFLFSSCSVDYFTNFILSLNNSCLTDTVSALQSSLGIIPNQELSAHALCREIFGISFQACGGTEFGSKICDELRCYNASAPVSTILSCPFLGTKVLDGTTCGNKRWCQGGTCVHNSSAPEELDDCPIGDLAHNFQVRADEPYVCSNMPASYCYSPEIYNVCCYRCNKIKDSTKPGCEYGDYGGKGNCTSPMILDGPFNIE